MPSLLSACCIMCCRRFGSPEVWSSLLWLRFGLNAPGLWTFWSFWRLFRCPPHCGGIYSDSPTFIAFTRTSTCFSWLHFVSRAIRPLLLLLFGGGLSACPLPMSLHPGELLGQVGCLPCLLLSSWPLCSSSFHHEDHVFSSLYSPLFVSLSFSSITS